MNTTQPSIFQIAADICAQANALDETRKRKFLDWMQAHHRTQEQIYAEGLPVYLETWFESLSAEGVAWEYRLILGEIAWWRDLDDTKLVRMLGASRK